MKEHDAPYAAEKLVQLKSEFDVDVIPDWGYGDGKAGGPWQEGTWVRTDLDRLYDMICLFSTALGGNGRILQALGGVTVQKSDIGSHAGEAFAHQVKFAKKGPVSSWSIVHEFAHAWDANYGWRLSRKLEQYSGGFTSRILSRFKKWLGAWDAGPRGREDLPGRHGRRPGCNAAGYFYGDKPSGANWLFNRKEDFAEAVAMYLGWEGENELSDHAHKRILRYVNFKNGEKDGFGVVDNWQDYARYFYPDEGNYKKTKRWRFVDELVNRKAEM
ncbi:MAG: hypothetical protein AB1649_20185 [Chloroflexota bacterium]